MKPLDIVSVAKSIARKAGDNILMPGFKAANKNIEMKSRTNLVTEFDRKSEEYIVGEIRRRFPGHGVIGEEGGSVALRADTEYLWFVDPLDATNNFAHGIPHFCVSIGVYDARQKKMVAGVVYEPVRDELFWGYEGGGAYLNRERIFVSKVDEIGVAMLATGFPYDKDDDRIDNIAQTAAFLKRSQCIRRMGSAALDLCYVACGRVEGFWEPMLWPWDTSAGALLVTEAGGRVSDYRGNGYNPETPEMVASNGALHAVMLEILAKATEYYPSEVTSRKPFFNS